MVALFIIYFMLFCWILSKLKIVKKSEISIKIVLLLFIIRVCYGLLNGYLNIYFFFSTDTKWFHLRGLEEYHLLLNNPKEYIQDILVNTHNNHYAGFFNISNSYWNDLKNNIMNKLLSLLDLISFGDFYINILLYNFLVFISSLLLFNLFIKKYPFNKKVLIISIFTLPSFLYFTSGLHKEGVLFITITFIIYNFYQLYNGKFAIKKVLLILTSLIFILLLRNFTFFLLIPALVAWGIANIYKRSTLQIFIFFYGFFLIIFFSSNFLSGGILNLPQLVVDRQAAFIKLSKNANSGFNETPLHSTISSYLINFLPSINRAVLRPYPWEKSTIFYLALSLETTIYLLLFLCFLLFNYKNKGDPLIHFCIFFSISMFLLIGYTVPIIGAISRYRSLYIPFVIIPILCNINWTRLLKAMNVRKIN